MTILGLLQDFRRNRSGVALIEMVFVAPFIMLLLFGAVELSRYVLIVQHVERASYAVGDILSQYTPTELTEDNIKKLGPQLRLMLQPYDGDDRQVVIFSSLSKRPADNQIIVNWQRAVGGSFSNEETVSIVNGRNANAANGSPNGLPATLSGDVAAQLRPGLASGMARNENMIVAELFYRYEPVFAGVLAAIGFERFAETSATVARRTFFHPRNGDLTHIYTSTVGIWGATNSRPLLCSPPVMVFPVPPDCPAGDPCNPIGSECTWLAGPCNIEWYRTCEAAP